MYPRYSGQFHLKFGQTCADSVLPQTFTGHIFSSRSPVMFSLGIDFLQWHCRSLLGQWELTLSSRVKVPNDDLSTSKILGSVGEYMHLPSLGWVIRGVFYNFLLKYQWNWAQTIHSDIKKFCQVFTLSYFIIPFLSPFLPRVNFHLNYLHINSYNRLCFRRTQDQKEIYITSTA